MFSSRPVRARALSAGAVASAAAFVVVPAARAAQVGDVFVIAMENHNWTQPSTDVSAPQQIQGNPNAPFINLITGQSGYTAPAGYGTPTATLFGSSTPINISTQVSYSNHYYNVQAAAVGAPSIHPSEPNYIWSEAGTNFGVANDNQPYQSPGGTAQNTTNHLTGFMSLSGQSWRSYQEDVDVDANNNLLPRPNWVVPVNNASGSYSSNPNAYNGSTQYNYAAKHNPMVFFNDTSGINAAPAGQPNPVGTALAQNNYAPLQQFQADLNNNTVAKYNWITPDQFNDMHTALTGGYTPAGSTTPLTGDNANIRQGDDFLSKIVPTIMASQAYRNNGVIVLWWDETEGVNQNDLTHTVPEIIISPLARGNDFSDPANSYFTHSSDLRTWEELFNVGNTASSPYLNDANNVSDLSGFFQPGALPSGVSSFFGVTPEPASLGLLALGAPGLLARRRRGGT